MNHIIRCLCSGQVATRLSVILIHFKKLGPSPTIKKTINAISQQENIHRFYTWGKWKALREQVLKLDKYECQLCKKRGKYTKATTVHHVNYVKKHPDKALEIWYSFRGEKRRNLISLCHDCHEEVHGYRKQKKKEPMTEEKW